MVNLGHESVHTHASSKHTPITRASFDCRTCASDIDEIYGLVAPWKCEWESWGQGRYRWPYRAQFIFRMVSWNTYPIDNVDRMVFCLWPLLISRRRNANAACGLLMCVNTMCVKTMGLLDGVWWKVHGFWSVMVFWMGSVVSFERFWRRFCVEVRILRWCAVS